MIQATLFNYFNCNGSIQPLIKKTSLFKQTTLTDYNFNIIPKKKNLLDYFKPKDKPQEEKKEEKEVFELVLVDINESRDYDIKCVKRNMYDPDLRYIVISYRWGELNEQQVKTPDYTAHITSFDLYDLTRLCDITYGDPDLCNIRYLWIDAISIDQQNHARKKEIILKMNQIYTNATYILAIPDLHKEYLLKNVANKEILDLIVYKYRETIYNEIFNMKHSVNNDKIKSLMIHSSQQQQQQQHTNNDLLSIFQKLKIENDELKKEIKESKSKQEMDELKKVYQFLAYLIDDWSNRAWVISEYHIAKEKYKKHGTPLKYTFISLYKNFEGWPFFSYHFNDDSDEDQQQHYTINNENNDMNRKRLTGQEVNDSKTLNQFVKERFMQRSHLEMILNSNASRNEDRFNAILPSWKEYNHIIKNKDTVSKWNITDMTSVMLKLYEIMNNGNLWDKAGLLYANTLRYLDGRKIIFPTFACRLDIDKLKLIERVNYNNIAYKEFEEKALEYIQRQLGRNEVVEIKQLINEYKINSKAIWTENLTSIQFEQNHCRLLLKSKKYIIKNDISYRWDYFQEKLSLDHDDELHYVCIPFFTFTIPECAEYLKLYIYTSQICLVGNMDKNVWVITNTSFSYITSGSFCSDDYTFNIY